MNFYLEMSKSEKNTKYPTNIPALNHRIENYKKEDENGDEEGRKKHNFLKWNHFFENKIT